MHLLHTATHKHHEFLGKFIPPYAILSHRWEDGEVTFQELRDVRCVEKEGWEKIKKCCVQAAEDGFEYVWIDSCCIDKSSSAELSEAINSMYQWYRDAQVCYAFLSDVPAGDEDPHKQNSAFHRSKWFSRGWTLQELLAPEMVVFFNRDWVEIGTKSSLKLPLESITGVKVQHLWDSLHASVAQRMSWASKRKTTRIEDTAYCLMGLFGVNMPPLYGEGKKAFLRLELEILRTSGDGSIFAWVDSGVHVSGLLAGSPALFAGSGNVISMPTDIMRTPHSKINSMTNGGLQIEVPLLPDQLLGSSNRTALFGPQDTSPISAPLNCFVDGEQLAIELLNYGSSNQFYRSAGQTLLSMAQQYQRTFNEASIARISQTKAVYVTQFDMWSDSGEPSLVYINIQSLLQHGFSLRLRYFYKGQGRQSGEQDVEGSTLTLFGSESIDFPTSGAMILAFQKDAQSFSVYFRKTGYAAGLQLEVSELGMSVLELNPNSTSYNYNTRDDRVSKDLGFGQRVSATLKKGVDSGRPQYVVKITIEES